MCYLLFEISSFESTSYSLLQFIVSFIDNEKRKMYGTACKDSLLHELRIRLAHNQSRISTVKATINNFLDTKYLKQYLDISLKLTRHCNGKTDEDIAEYDQELSCSQDVLNIDALKPIRRYFPNVQAELLQERDNILYRELVSKSNTNYHDHEIK